MFLLSTAQAAVYVPNFSVDRIKPYKFDYYTLCLSNKENSNISIYECKYLISKKNIYQDQVSLTFFLIHDIAEEISPTKYKLFIQKYLEIDNQKLITLFLQKFKLENQELTSIIKLNKIEPTNDINSIIFKPFVTAIPVKNDQYKIIGIQETEISQQRIIERVSDKFRKNFYNQINVEFKSNQDIIINRESITDDKNIFIVKKGIQYSVEFIDHDTIWINLSCTNFSRTVNSVNNLGLKEPINYNNHRLVNIKTGRTISRKIQNVSEIKDPEYVFDTFDSTKAFSQRCDNLRFSQEKFWFEQTNLQDTMTLINDLEKSSNNKSNIIYFEDINKIDYRYKIIHITRKYLFADGDLHYTSPKGLYKSGVFKMPDKLELKLLVSSRKLAIEPLSNIVKNINERLYFLYKNYVQPICEKNVIVFDYIDFNKDSLKSQLENKQYNYIVHLIDPKEIPLNDKIQIETIDIINQIVISFLKTNSLKFEILNTFDENTVANLLLKLGLRNKAIPWKIQDVDPQDPDHIFIGIDLGHNHKDKLSNLTITLIDNFGCLLPQSYTRQNLQLNEVISYEELLRAFKWIVKNLPRHIQGITIHRDGLITQEELEYFHQVMYEVKIEKYNLVEVIKSGVPRIGFYSNYNSETRYLDGFMGYYIFANNISYLITNDQCLRTTKTVPNPLKIKKIYGYKKISSLTEEIYWLTKAYSTNIFEPTHLPITTLLANNWSYSRNLVHFTTE